MGQKSAKSLITQCWRLEAPFRLKGGASLASGRSVLGRPEYPAARWWLEDVAAFVVLGEVETLGLLLFGDTQTHGGFDH